MSKITVDDIRELEVIEAAGLGLDQVLAAQILLAARNFVVGLSGSASKPLQEWTVDEIILAVKGAGSLQ